MPQSCSFNRSIFISLISPEVCNMKPGISLNCEIASLPNQNYNFQHNVPILEKMKANILGYFITLKVMGFSIKNMYIWT